MKHLRRKVRYATTLNLSRVLLILEEVYPNKICLSKIRQATNLTSFRVKNALSWLVNHGLVKQDSEDGVKVYYIE